MRRFLRSIFSIASATSLELASQPESLLLLITGIVLTTLVPLLHFHDFGEPGRIVRDGGLAYQLVIGTALAAFSVSRSIRRELEDGIALASLAKPISRSAFLLGKWLGTCIMIFRFWMATLAVTIVATRISPRFVEQSNGSLGYLTDNIAQVLLLMIPIFALLIAGLLHNKRRIRFCLVASSLAMWFSIATLTAALLFDREWQFAPSLSNAPLAIVGASIAILLAISTICAFATALSTRLPSPAIAATAAAIVAVGLSWDAIVTAHQLLSIVPMPNIQALWLVDSLAAGGSVNLQYLALAFIYSSALTAFAIISGSIALDTADIS